MPPKISQDTAAPEGRRCVCVGVCPAVSRRSAAVDCSCVCAPAPGAAVCVCVPAAGEGGGTAHGNKQRDESRRHNQLIRRHLLKGNQRPAVAKPPRQEPVLQPNGPLSSRFSGTKRLEGTAGDGRVGRAQLCMIGPTRKSPQAPNRAVRSRSSCPPSIASWQSKSPPAQMKAEVSDFVMTGRASICALYHAPNPRFAGAFPSLLPLSRRRGTTKHALLPRRLRRAARLAARCVAPAHSDSGRQEGVWGVSLRAAAAAQTGFSPRHSIAQGGEAVQQFAMCGGSVTHPGAWPHGGENPMVRVGEGRRQDRVGLSPR